MSITVQVQGKSIELSDWKSMNNTLESVINSAKTYYGSYVLSKDCKIRGNCNCGFKICCALRYEHLGLLAESFAAYRDTENYESAGILLEVYDRFLAIEKPTVQ